MSNESTHCLSPQSPQAQTLGVQPGGGFCYSIELAWGALRRRWLKTFCSPYVERMATLRLGSTEGAPHEVLDPRDLKYCSTQCTAYWRDEDDPFAWRSRLPFVRWGLAELQLMGWPLAIAAIVLLASPLPWRYLGAIPLTMLGLVAWFFRDPIRSIPNGPDDVVSPADGVIAEVTRLEHDEFLGVPALRIGIFLSIFNVHVNRAPRAGRVVEVRYKPGEFLNAMNPESALRNETLWLACEDLEKPALRWKVRQISGLFARRIVCVAAPGRAMQRGEKFGMIKLGSRTELILPADDVEVLVGVGQKVAAGSTVVARLSSR